MRICFATIVSIVGISTTALGQNPLSITVLDSSSNEPIPGVNVVVQGTTLGGVTDRMGRLSLAGISTGSQTITFSCVGYRSVERGFDFPLADPDTPVRIVMPETGVDIGEVTVTSTRTSYHIDDAPVRIEVKGREDIEETMIDHPANISELFLESTGIDVVRTSPVSNFVSIRLQGLDGSYTQILKDGFPLYGGLSSDLSATQIPPLDLSRVEIIKGPSSSLYGAGAMAGIINLVSKRPEEGRHVTLLLNGASSRGADGGMFYTDRSGRLGLTLLLQGDATSAYDGDHTGFSDIPRQGVFTVSPTVFYDVNDKTNVMFGFSSTWGNQSSGDMIALADGASSSHPYLDHTRSNRSSTRLSISSVIDNVSINFKNSFGYFFLDRSGMWARFGGNQYSSFTELSAQRQLGEHLLTGGMNLTTERFIESHPSPYYNRSYALWIAGLFAQDDWQPVKPFTLEAGVRTDLVRDHGVQVVPRLSGIYRVSDMFTVRSSLGLGYQPPTLFSDQSDPDNVFLLIPVQNVSVERSLGGEFDCTWKTSFSKTVSMVVNQAFFYTRIDDPIIPFTDITFSPVSSIELVNGPGYLYSEGAETDVRLVMGDLEAFIGYTYTNAMYSFGSNRELFLTPAHRFVTDVMFDAEELGKVGLELRYTGPQRLHTASRPPGFWVVDCLFQTEISRVTLFAGVENLFDFKEADHTPVVTGFVTSPIFNDVWGPLEGRIFNAGLKFQM